MAEPATENQQKGWRYSEQQLRAGSGEAVLSLYADGVYCGSHERTVALPSQFIGSQNGKSFAGLYFTIIHGCGEVQLVMVTVQQCLLTLPLFCFYF